MKRILLTLAAMTAVGCSTSDSDLESAFCAGLEESAVRTVSAKAQADAASDVTDAQRVDIQLAALGGSFGGFVSYRPDEAGRFAFGLTHDLTFTIRDAAGMTVPIDKTVTGSTVCQALAVRHTATLGLQSYTIELGGDSPVTIGFIAEESDDDL